MKILPLCAVTITMFQPADFPSMTDIHIKCTLQKMHTWMKFNFLWASVGGLIWNPHVCVTPHTDINLTSMTMITCLHMCWPCSRDLCMHACQQKHEFPSSWQDEAGIPKIHSKSFSHLAVARDQLLGAVPERSDRCLISQFSSDLIQEYWSTLIKIK